MGIKEFIIEKKKKDFTIEMYKGIPKETLKDAYFYISRELVLEKTSNPEDVVTTKSGQVVVSKNENKEIIQLSPTIPGKIIDFSKEDEVRIQFGADASRSLLFKYEYTPHEYTGYNGETKVMDSRNYFQLEHNYPENTLMYNNAEYKSEKAPYVKLQIILQERSMSKRNKEVETGAW